MRAVDFFVNLGITQSGGIAAISLDTTEWDESCRTGSGDEDADPVASC